MVQVEYRLWYQITCIKEQETTPARNAVVISNGKIVADLQAAIQQEMKHSFCAGVDSINVQLYKVSCRL
jgi:hypothetical protein